MLVGIFESGLVEVLGVISLGSGGGRRRGRGLGEVRSMGRV